MHYSNGDADHLIVVTDTRKSAQIPTIVIGDDTDLLCCCCTIQIHRVKVSFLSLSQRKVPRKGDLRISKRFKMG